MPNVNPHKTEFLVLKRVLSLFFFLARSKLAKTLVKELQHEEENYQKDEGVEVKIHLPNKFLVSYLASFHPFLEIPQREQLLPRR